MKVKIEQLNTIRQLLTILFVTLLVQCGYGQIGNIIWRRILIT